MRCLNDNHISLCDTIFITRNWKQVATIEYSIVGRRIKYYVVMNLLEQRVKGSARLYYTHFGITSLFKIILHYLWWIRDRQSSFTKVLINYKYELTTSNRIHTIELRHFVYNYSFFLSWSSKILKLGPLVNRYFLVSNDKNKRRWDLKLNGQGIYFTNTNERTISI